LKSWWALSLIVLGILVTIGSVHYTTAEDESLVEIEGSLDLLHSHLGDGSIIDEYYIFSTKEIPGNEDTILVSKIYRLDFEEKHPSLFRFLGKDVKITGRVISNEVSSASSLSYGIIDVTSLSPIPTVKKTDEEIQTSAIPSGLSSITLLTAFNDSTGSVPHPPEYYEEKFYTGDISVDSYFFEYSGENYLGGTDEVTEWKTLREDRDHYLKEDGEGNRVFDQIQLEKDAIQLHDPNLDNFDQIIFIFDQEFGIKK